MTSPTGPNVMTTSEAAEYLRVSRATLARWRDEDTGPNYAQPGRKVFYLRADLDAWIGLAASAEKP